MCGIIGFKGESEASEILFKGLKKLEYRGYDSAGIATVGNPSLKIQKGEGTVDEAVEKRPDGSTGIGHTRWATHGGVNDTNAHPHTDCEEKVAVVHNGIINNYEELKQQLQDKGHSFRSETDTEVLPHLIEDELEKVQSLEEVAQNVADRIQGSYAIVATLESGEMIAMKNESPLVLAEENNEFFLASDVTPFLEHTDSAAFLEDGDNVILDQKSCDIYSSGKKVEREFQEIEWDPKEASKQGYDHYMMKEIEEQSSTVKRAAFQDRKELKKAVDLLEKAENIYITGCGTSSYAASLGAHYLREAGYEAEVEQSHEMEYRSEEINEEDLLIGLSQSGETADLLSMIEETEADLMAVVNVVGSTLDRTADHSFYVNAGPEIGVASTKAFTAQLTVMKLVSYAAKGKIEQGRKSLTDTADKIEKTIKQNEENIEELSQYLLDRDHTYFIGREKGFDIAREAALKLKELSYIHAEAFPGGEFKHGTLALVEEGTPVFGFLKEEGYQEMISNITEAKSRGADIIGIGDESIEGFRSFIEIPEDPNREILEIVPFQLLAYRTAVKKGHNPDKPRNLAKSVTVK